METNTGSALVTESWRMSW